MTTPTPPRLIGDAGADLAAIVEWAWMLYRDLVVQSRLTARLDAIAAVAPLDITVSDPPTQDEVLAVAARLNDIISAAGGANGSS